MFAYCGNNPVNFIDFTGTSEEPIWVKMGFVYDGSMRDFKRLNQGLPPYAYERFLANGGTVNANYTENLGMGITKCIQTMIYIPADQTKDFYIHKMQKNIGNGVLDTSSFAIGTALLFVKKVPHWISFALWGLDALLMIDNWIDEKDIEAYENAMNEGTGVLVVVWSIQGPRCGSGWNTSYYSWNGEGEPF